jgi:hypothetical protein
MLEKRKKAKMFFDGASHFADLTCNLNCFLTSETGLDRLYQLRRPTICI